MLREVLPEMRLLTCTILLIGFCSLSHGQFIGVEPDFEEDEALLWAYNSYPCPVTLSATASNIDTTFKKYIPDNEKRALIKSDSLRDLIVNARDMLSYNFVLGNPKAVHDESYQYSLPYPPGSSYKLTQGNDTPFSHNVPIAKYAYDFAMPEGSFISAARSGVVGFVLDHNVVGGNSKQLKDKSNRILVCHDDGTVAAYGHLQHKGGLVEVGDRVFVGQVIGLSGNTGYSTSPHLHFTVLIGDESIPIKFRNRGSNLVEGQVYEHK